MVQFHFYLFYLCILAALQDATRYIGIIVYERLSFFKEIVDNSIDEFSDQGQINIIDWLGQDSSQLEQIARLLKKKNKYYKHHVL